jgi:glyoxylase-like metal-dependent hydrolase (beta-lactamase superfamily II)
LSTSAGLKALKLEMNAGGHPFVVHPALIWDEHEVILVDTGIPGQLELIRDLLERESFSLGRLTKIIITHQDRDHIGSLPELLEACGGRVQVLAHEKAVPYIQGEIPLVKSGAMAVPCKVDVILKDGDELPYGGGIRVMFTPGHSPDHISLYHPLTKTLVSGDVLTSQDGVLMPPDPKFTPEYDMALQSVARLSELDVESVITYHGGICTGGIRERLLEISGFSNRIG